MATVQKTLPDIHKGLKQHPSARDIKLAFQHSGEKWKEAGNTKRELFEAIIIQKYFNLFKEVAEAFDGNIEEEYANIKIIEIWKSSVIV